MGPRVTSARRRARDNARVTRPRSILHRLRVESPSSSSTAGPQSRHEHSEAMSISVAWCTIKENRLQLRRGLNRYSKPSPAFAYRELTSARTQVGEGFWLCGCCRQESNLGLCPARVAKRVCRPDPPPVENGVAKPVSSNHRERARVMSPCRRATNVSTGASGACAIGETFRSHIFQCQFPYWFFAFSNCSARLWLRTTPFA